MPESNNRSKGVNYEKDVPVGKGNYKVDQGECLCSIAKRTGHFWKTIWNHGGNADLNRERKDPNVLLPGDRLVVPEIQKSYKTAETEERHRFIRRGMRTRLRIQVLGEARGRGQQSAQEESPSSQGDHPETGADEDGPVVAVSEEEIEKKPRANAPYLLDVDGDTIEGRTDGDGFLSVPIPPDASRAMLRVGEPPDQEEFVLALGSINPKDTISGIQQRLNNLGYPAGMEDGQLTPKIQEALLDFQAAHGLKRSGEPDEATWDSLFKRHGQ